MKKNKRKVTTAKFQQQYTQQQNQLPFTSPSILQDAVSLISPLSATIQKSIGLINEMTSNQEQQLHHIDEYILSTTLEQLEACKRDALSCATKKIAICDQMMEEVTSAVYWIEFYINQVQKWHEQQKAMEENFRQKSMHSEISSASAMNGMSTELRSFSGSKHASLSTLAVDKKSKKSAERLKMEKKLEKLMKKKKEYETNRQWPQLVNQLGDLYNEDFVSSDDERFCYCQRVSFGRMIGCDNEEKCKHKWFHFACVDIHKEPKDNVKWFCPSCRAILFKEVMKKK